MGKETDGFYRLGLTFKNLCEFIIADQSYSPTKEIKYEKKDDRTQLGCHRVWKIL